MFDELMVYEITSSPGAIRVGYHGRPRHEPHGVVTREWGKRKPITQFTERARIRMRYVFATVDWCALDGPLALITLTYPTEFPMDGRTVHRHLDNFRRRWLHEFGSVRGIWTMEFQRRGAPHFHLYMELPAPAKQVRKWAKPAWYEIVGSEDPQHLRRGVHLGECKFGTRDRNAAEIAEYFWKHNAKVGGHRQKRVPEGFENVGKFWGKWNLPVVKDTVEVPREVYVPVRRVLARLRNEKAQTLLPAPGGLSGLWSLCNNGMDLGPKLIAWAEDL